MVVPMTKGKKHAEDAHLEIEPGAPDDPRENVAAEIVGAEEMDRIGRLQRRLQILGDGVVGRQPGAASATTSQKRQSAPPT